MKCERCGNEAKAFKMSIFEPVMCCLDCIVKERQQPKYKEAKEEEARHIRMGDYNFKGIGKPDDL